MTLILIAIGIAMACVMVLRSVKRARNRNELEQYSLSAEQLESLMASGQKVYLFDVRQPLDLLAYPELIPGAKRISPEEVLRTASLLPRDEDIVVYCTCPGDKTSLAVLHRALALGFTRIKFLTRRFGGLERKRVSCGTLPRLLSAFDSNCGSACAMIIEDFRLT